MKIFNHISLILIFLVSGQAVFAMTSEECSKKNGLIVNSLANEHACVAGKNIGKVSGMDCPCVCCVGEKIIDCQKNKVELSDLCDAGTELRFHVKITGSEIPTGIAFSLQGENWSGNTDMVMIAPD